MTQSKSDPAQDVQMITPNPHDPSDETLRAAWSDFHKSVGEQGLTLFDYGTIFRAAFIQGHRAALRASPASGVGRDDKTAPLGAPLDPRSSLRKQIAKAIFKKRYEPISDVAADRAFDHYERVFFRDGAGAARVTEAGLCVELADAAMPFATPPAIPAALSEKVIDEAYGAYVNAAMGGSSARERIKAAVGTAFAFANTERRLNKLEGMGFKDAADFARNPKSEG